MKKIQVEQCRRVSGHDVCKVKGSIQIFRIEKGIITDVMNTKTPQGRALHLERYIGLKAVKVLSGYTPLEM